MDGSDSYCDMHKVDPDVSVNTPQEDQLSSSPIYLYPIPAV